jgi:hypothetical protein
MRVYTSVGQKELEPKPRYITVHKLTWRFRLLTAAGTLSVVGVKDIKHLGSGPVYDRVVWGTNVITLYDATQRTEWG